MQSNLIRYSLGTKLYFKGSRYNFGICNGYVVGLHDDFVKVLIEGGRNDTRVARVKFEDILSIYEDD
jgi:hypothetical protein